MKASGKRSELVDHFSEYSFSEAVNRAAWFICPAYIFPRVFARFIEFKLQEMDTFQDPSLDLIRRKVDFRQVKKIKRNDRLIFGSTGPNSIFDFFTNILSDAFPKKKDQVHARLILSLIDKLGVPTQSFKIGDQREDLLIPPVGNVSEEEVFRLAEVHTRNFSNRIASLVGLQIPWVNSDYGIGVSFETDLSTAVTNLGHQRLPPVRSEIDAIGGEVLKAIAQHIIFGGTHLLSTPGISDVLTRLDPSKTGRYFCCGDSLRLAPRYLPFAAAASSACAMMDYQFVQENISERDKVALRHEKQSALEAIGVLTCKEKMSSVLEEVNSGNLTSDIFGHTMNFSSENSALQEFTNDLAAINDLLPSGNQDATFRFHQGSNSFSDPLQAYLSIRCLEADLLGGDWQTVIRESSFPEICVSISAFIHEQKAQGVECSGYLNRALFSLVDSAVSECFEFLSNHKFVEDLNVESRDAFLEGEQELISRIKWKPTPKVQVPPGTWNNVLNSYARSVEAELLHSLVNPRLNEIVDDDDSFPDSYIEQAITSSESALFAKILKTRRRQKKDTSTSLPSHKSDPCLGDMLFLFQNANHLPKDISEDSPLLARICSRLINDQTAPIFDPSSLLLLAEINEFRKDGSHPRSNDSEQKVTQERAVFARRMIVAYLHLLGCIKVHAHGNFVCRLLLGIGPHASVEPGLNPFES